MHKLLIRQLRRLRLNNSGDIHITGKTWEKFLTVISESYEQADKDREMVERSLRLASDELFQRNRELRKNILELQDKQEIISFQAKHDALTKLPNRFSYMDQLEQVLANEDTEKQFAVLFVDLDKFKHINDNYGHQFGDELLCIMSERLQGCLREGDLLARFGGDEFMALLKNIDDLESVQKVVERFLQEITEPFQISECEFNISASIGVSLYPKDGTDRDTLIRKADLAMYQAKEMGRNNIKYYN